MLQDRPPGAAHPTLRLVCGFFNVSQFILFYFFIIIIIFSFMNTEVLWGGAYDLKSLSEKTWNSIYLQM